MWVNRYAWRQLIESAQYLQGIIAQRDLALERAESTILSQATENARLRERLITAEGRARGAQALSDAFTVRTNQLQAERDQLFTKIFNPEHPVAIRTPVVGQMARIMPDASLFTDPAELVPGASGPGEDIPMEEGREVDPDEGIAGEVFRDPREQVT